MSPKYSEYDLLCVALEDIKKKINGFVPQVGIICGSGLGDICNIVDNKVSIPYADIPNFPQSTVVGHSGELVFGYIDQTKVVCMRGRVHLYEGYDVIQCIRPVRLMRMLGIEILCVTNAAGNVNKNFQPGDFMIIRDHISFPALSGENPLRGPHDSRFGERFVTMANAYDKDLIRTLEEVGVECGLEKYLKKGTYAMVMGPTYETVAEAKALKLLGADTLGMSTVHEIITAHQMGVRCLGISLITNNVITEYESAENLVEHQHVVDMGKKRSLDFITLVRTFIKTIHNSSKVTEPILINGNSNGNGKAIRV